MLRFICPANLIPAGIQSIVRTPLQKGEIASRQIETALAVGREDLAAVGRLRPYTHDTGTLVIDGLGTIGRADFLAQDLLENGFVISSVHATDHQAKSQGRKPAKPNAQPMMRLTISFENPEYQGPDRREEIFKAEIPTEVRKPLCELMGATWSQAWMYDNRDGGTPTVTFNASGFLGHISDEGIKPPRYAFCRENGDDSDVVLAHNPEHPDNKAKIEEATAAAAAVA